jgi:hypothetical protein
VGVDTDGAVAVGEDITQWVTDGTQSKGGRYHPTALILDHLVYSAAPRPPADGSRYCHSSIHGDASSSSCTPRHMDLWMRT